MFRQISLRLEPRCQRHCRSAPLAAPEHTRSARHKFLTWQGRSSLPFPFLMNELIQDLFDFDCTDTSSNTPPLAQRGAIKMSCSVFVCYLGRNPSTPARL